MTTIKRLDLLERLGNYMVSEQEEWAEAKWRATNENAWFTEEEINYSVESIVTRFLDKKLLQDWLKRYRLPATVSKVGIVAAGNIPLVGFHDFLCGFLSGHQIFLKLSSKDTTLLTHLINKLIEWEPSVANQIFIADQLKNCEAYIATGSNNTSRYFEQYFGKFPHIIRKNRTSVAILEGDETNEELTALAGDIFRYFGLGCRNVTQVCVPRDYDFSYLLEILKSEESRMLHHKYKNNYDYHLAIYLLNKVPYLNNGSLLLVENELPFSAVSVLHYRYYDQLPVIAKSLQDSGSIQTIVGRGFTPFGQSQKPSLDEYADGVDTMEFLCNLQ